MNESVAGPVSRARFRALGAAMDQRLLRKYELRPVGHASFSLYRKARRAFGRLLRRWGLRPPVPLEPWLVALTHGTAAADAAPVLVLAVGVDRDDLRARCARLSTNFASRRDIAPVLVTDVADFACFSRLGWLVEFVPALSGSGRPYADSKLAYLAWRYRSAPVIEIASDFESGQTIEELARE